MNEMVRTENVIRALVERYELISEQDIRNTVNSVQGADYNEYAENMEEEWPSLFMCSMCGESSDDTTTFDHQDIKYCPNCGRQIRRKHNGM